MKQANYTIKRLYCKPTMKVIKLQHQSHILVGSGVGAQRSAYRHARTDGSESTEEEVWQ